MRWRLVLAALLIILVACGQSEARSSRYDVVRDTTINAPTFNPPTLLPVNTPTPLPSGEGSSTENRDLVSDEGTPPSAGAAPGTAAAPPAPETGQPKATQTPENVKNEVKMDELTTTPSGLQYRDLIVGGGTAAAQGNTAVVHYTGWLLDGTKFDSSKDRNQPFEFVIGAGRVIRGWEEGVGSMNVGGVRELIIPSDLAYGDTGAGGLIPAGATLKFEVELLDLK